MTRDQALDAIYGYIEDGDMRGAAGVLDAIEAAALARVAAAVESLPSRWYISDVDQDQVVVRAAVLALFEPKELRLAVSVPPVAGAATATLGDLHVVPVDQEHGNATCWCQPIIDYIDPVSGRRVWVHRRALDLPHYEAAE